MGQEISEFLLFGTLRKAREVDPDKRCSGGGRHLQCQETGILAEGKSNMPSEGRQQQSLECGQFRAVHSGEPVSGGCSPGRGEETRPGIQPSLLPTGSTLTGHRELNNNPND